MPWNRESNEEYDDGFTRESFERADEDRPEDMEPHDAIPVFTYTAPVSALPTDYTDEDLARRGLPTLAFYSSSELHIPIDAPVVAVKRGEKGYYPIQTTLSPDDLNQGVTPSALEAMLAGSLFGWHVPASYPQLFVTQPDGST